MSAPRACTVTFKTPLKTSGHTTCASSLFEAARNAIRWWTEDCRIWGTQIEFRDDDVLEVHLVGGRSYRVRVGGVRREIETARHPYTEHIGFAFG